jgi:hypothetical protein
MIPVYSRPSFRPYRSLNMEGAKKTRPKFLLSGESEGIYADSEADWGCLPNLSIRKLLFRGSSLTVDQGSFCSLAHIEARRVR